jgi:hypothetical protein
LNEKPKITTNQINSDGRELKGLQDLGKIVFDCADCGLELLTLQLVTTTKASVSEVLTRVSVKCGQCGGYSFVKQVGGQFFPGAPSDNMVFDVMEADSGSPDADVLFKAWRK